MVWLKRILITLLILVVLIVGAAYIFLPKDFRQGLWFVLWKGDFSVFGEGQTVTAQAAQRIKTAPGFAVNLYATGIDNARFMRFAPNGDLLISQPRLGQIMALRDTNDDGKADDIKPLVQNLKQPHGLDFYQDWLYIGETHAIGRIQFDTATGQTSGSYEQVITGLPEGGNHWSKTIRFGADEQLYVSIGSSCNVCEEADERRATMMRYAPDGSAGKIYATGLRNSVGFDWGPDGQLYATDNGRDLLGDNFPPCELNVVEEDEFYGWPYANGANVVDPDLGAGHEEQIADAMPPTYDFRAHTAPLGMTFIRTASVPTEYKNAALVALHGSWNRSTKDGYEVISLHWDETGKIRERVFLSGFEQDENVIGRPVDVVEGPDGAFYISDDYGKAIYRVAYTGNMDSTESGITLATEAVVENPLAGVIEEVPAERLSRGQVLYEAHQCASCHEAEYAAEGVVVKPYKALAQRYTVDSMTAFLATPTPPMPVFPMDEEARRDVAVYLLKEK
ncbi:MAG: PQQ-dependent sugar dehydrogenase [Pseudomonadota bacterium]